MLNIGTVAEAAPRNVEARRTRSRLLVRRAALLDRLMASPGHRCVVIDAPAGFGSGLGVG